MRTLRLDITQLADVVARLDRSGTLRSFAAVLTPFLVLWNLGAIIGAVQELAVPPPYSYPDDGPAAHTILILATLGAFAPAAFIVSDWMSRGAWGRFYSTVLTALLGTALLLGVAAILIALALLIDEFEPDLFGNYTLRNFTLTVYVPMLLLLAAWLVFGWTRVVAGIFWGLVLLAAAFAIGLPILLLRDDALDPAEVQAELPAWFAMWVFGALAMAWIAGALRVRIFLSSELPRSMMLGMLRDAGFWKRFALLVGLPSSYWTLRKLRTPAFWLFVVARPLVYLGAASWFSESPVPSTKITLAVTLVALGHAAFHAGKRLAARDIWNHATGDDSPAPVLFLRSFEDDQFALRRRWWDLAGRWFDLWSLRRNADELLLDEAAQYGPVVALGRPGEKRTPFGAMRYYATHDDWRQVIIDTARRARAIVIVADDSPGVKWELDMIAAEGLRERTLLLFPQQGRSGLEAATIACLHTTDTDTVLTAQRATPSCYVVALRSHFQERDARGQNRPTSDQ